MSNAGYTSMNTWKMLASMVGVLAVALFAGGCASGPSYGKHEIEVCLSNELKGKPVEVDLIPVMNDADQADWQAQNVTNYFSTTDKKRSETDGRMELKFSSGDTACKTVTAGDPMWESKWKGARSIVVLANIPLAESWGGRPDDRRRKVVTLLRGTWEQDKVRVEVGQSGVNITTPQKEPKS